MSFEIFQICVTPASMDTAYSNVAVFLHALLSFYFQMEKREHIELKYCGLVRKFDDCVCDSNLDKSKLIFFVPVFCLCCFARPLSPKWTGLMFSLI